MTTGEMIEKLKEFPKDTQISFNYRYGTDFGESESEYYFDPSFKFYDTLKSLEINLF